MNTNGMISRRRGLQYVGSALALATAPGAFAQSPAKAAPRVISLSGALTEIVYLLGAQDLLVATDTTSLFPEAATKTLKVGYMRQLAAEGVLSLKPDVVIGTQEAGPLVALDQIRGAGVRVALVPTPHNWAEVQAKVQLVGRETGYAPQAQALLNRLDAQWADVQKQVALGAQSAKTKGKARSQPRALFMLAHAGTPQVSGRGTAADALIRYAGATNAVNEFHGYRSLTAEAMAAAAPDVLINTTQGIEAMGGVAAFWRRPELALTPAFQKKALVMMDANELLGFGPRLPAVVQSVHAQIQTLLA